MSLAMASCAAFSKPAPLQRPSASAERGAEVRIATYNVFTGVRDVRRTLAVIRKTHADVVAMQEIAPRGAELLERALQREYPYCHFSNGLAIVSRYPLKHPRYQHSARGINGFLVVEVDHPGGRFQIGNLHLDPLRGWTTRQRLALPWQLMWRQGSVHRGELKQVFGMLRTDLPTVLVGDFNSASHAAPKRLRKLGYTDSFAALTSKPDRTPTLHFTLLGRPAGRRIDFIFHDRAFQPVRSWTLPGAPSDHDVVVSVLRRR